MREGRGEREKELERSSPRRPTDTARNCRDRSQISEVQSTVRDLRDKLTVKSPSIGSCSSLSLSRAVERLEGRREIEARNQSSSPTPSFIPTIPP